jgi:hypothetical protein
MNLSLSTLKSHGRAAIIALALGASTITAFPAPVAAAAPRFGIEFGISGGGSDFSFQFGRSGKKERRQCLDRWEVREGLRDAGFYEINFVDQTRRRFVVIARWDGDGRRYKMKINRCTGEVYDIERVRRRRDGSFEIELRF